LLFGQEGLEELVLGQARPREMGVVEDRVAVAGLCQRPRQGRLPDPFGEPEAARPAAEALLHLLSLIHI